METGEFIKKSIESRKMTKIRVTELLGISRTTLDDYIKGNTTPTVNQFKDFIEKLEIRQEEMLGFLYNNKQQLPTKTEGENKMIPIEIYKDQRKDLEKEQDRVDRLIALLELKYGSGESLSQTAG